MTPSCNFLRKFKSISFGIQTWELHLVCYFYNSVSLFHLIFWAEIPVVLSCSVFLFLLPFFFSLLIIAFRLFQTKDNETALHWAAQYGHTAVVSQLLEHGCDPTIHNAREESALDLAAQYGRLEAVDLLVRTHPELIEPYSRGSGPPGLAYPHTPLHLASRNGHR